jgi:hypothetical protein
MNVDISWGISQCSLCVSRRFGGAYNLHLQSKDSAEQETSVQHVPTRRYVPEDGNIHNYRRENLKSYNSVIVINLKYLLKSSHFRRMSFELPVTFHLRQM